MFMKAYAFSFCTVSGLRHNDLVVLASSRAEAEQIMLGHPAVLDYIQEMSSEKDITKVFADFRAAVKEHDTAGVVFHHSVRG